MKRLLVLLLLPVLLAGCMAGEVDEISSSVPPEAAQMTETAVPVSTPGPEPEEFPVLCDCEGHTYMDQYGRITIRQSNFRWSDTPCICGGDDGTAVWIDNMQVYHDWLIYYIDPCYEVYDILGGRDIAAINFAGDNRTADYWQTLLLFDMETKEQIAVPNYLVDFADIPKDHEKNILDVSALDAELLVEDCTYALMPKMAILYGERSRGGDYFESGSAAYLEEDGTLSCYIREPDFIGEMWLSYTYTDGEYQLTQVCTENDWLYEPYEPIPGKVLEARYREPDDGLKPAVKVPGMEILLGGEPLGYSEGDYSGRVVGVLCDLGSNEDALYLCVYVHDTWLELDSWTEVYDLNKMQAMDVERPYEWWYRNTPVKYESGKVE